METLLIKDESGIYHLTRNERPLLCPMQTRLLVPVPKSSSLMTGSPQNQMELQERSNGCNSMCALFQINKTMNRGYVVTLCHTDEMSVKCIDLPSEKQPENVILMPKP
jgi:hypothetical protein